MQLDEQSYMMSKDKITSILTDKLTKTSKGKFRDNHTVTQR